MGGSRLSRGSEGSAGCGRAVSDGRVVDVGGTRVAVGGSGVSVAGGGPVPQPRTKNGTSIARAMALFRATMGSSLLTFQWKQRIAGDKRSGQDSRAEGG